MEDIGKITQDEIYEIPTTMKKILNQAILVKQIAKEMIAFNLKHIFLVGAGSSYHAGFAMAYMFNRITQIPTFTEFSMEFNYLVKPILTKEDCVIGISQSGETKDTIEALKIGRKIGCLTIGLTNNVNSSMSKTCKFCISLQCDEEKSVLATKTYVAELTILSILCLELARMKNLLGSEEYDAIWNELMNIPEKIETILPILHEEIKACSNYFKFADFCFILGSGPDYATAMEASLKLKEGARIFGQAYSTAEFPHGPITLADSKAWIIAIIPHEEVKRKQNIIHLLKRIKERKATILGIYESTSENEIPEPIDFGIQVPNTTVDLQPILMILGIQLLTLEIARIKGINPDAPKFLTKVSGIE